MSARVLGLSDRAREIAGQVLVLQASAELDSQNSHLKEDVASICHLWWDEVGRGDRRL